MVSFEDRNKWLVTESIKKRLERLLGLVEEKQMNKVVFYSTRGRRGDHPCT